MFCGLPLTGSAASASAVDYGVPGRARPAKLQPGVNKPSLVNAAEAIRDETADLDAAAWCRAACPSCQLQWRAEGPRRITVRPTLEELRERQHQGQRSGHHDQESASTKCHGAALHHKAEGRVRFGLGMGMSIVRSYRRSWAPSR